jgi:hypothetical protein
MGILAPGSAYTRPSAQPPINTSGNFFGAHVLEGRSTNLKILWSIFSPFQAILFVYSEEEKNVTPNLIFFCDLKPYAKFWTPTITPCGRNVTGAERREKTPLIVET